MKNIRNTSRILLRFALGATVLIATIACGPPPPPPAPSNRAEQAAPKTAPVEREVGARGGTLRYRVAAPVKTFNYLAAFDEPTLIVTFFLMGGRLIEFDHDQQRYVPGLATAWENEANGGDGRGDGRTFSLTLREDARFSDGQSLTAEDVAFTFRAFYDERTASPLFRDLMTVNGRQIEVRVQDSRNLQVIFPESIAAPESYLSNVAVLPRHVLSEALERGTLRESYSLQSDAQTIVTSGPFAAQAARPGESVTLRRNEYYWKRDAANQQLPYLDSIVVESVPDANNAVTRLKTRTIDVIDRLRPNDYAALPHNNGDAAGRAIDLGPGLNTDHLWFNLNAGRHEDGRPIVDPVKAAWFRDARFRRAISQAVDRESIVDTVMQGLATPLHGFVSPGNRAWRAADLPHEPYDIARARDLLREANFTQRESTPNAALYDSAGNRVGWTLIVPAENEARKAMAAVIQEDLAKLGIDMQIAPVETGDLTRRWSQSFDYDAVLYGTTVTEPDPSSYAGVLQSSGVNHFWFPRQDKPSDDWERRIDELMSIVASERAEETRRVAFQQVQRVMAEQLPMIPIVSRHTLVATSVRLGNYRPSTIAPYSFWNAEEIFFKQE